MRRFIFLATAFLLTLCIGTAGNLSVRSFAPDYSDLSAATNQRLDMNGRPCALVIVELPVEGVRFMGNVVGDALFYGSQYWVYLTEGTKKLQILCPGSEALMVDLVEPGANVGLQSKTTYHLTLDGYETNSGGQSKPASPSGSYLAVQVTPRTGVIVRVNGEMQPVENGEVVMFLTKGNYDVAVEAAGYEPFSTTVNIDGSGTKTLDVILQSSMAKMTVNAATPGATIKINGKERGNGTFTGEFAPGDYLIECLKDGYRNYTQTVRLDKRDNKTVNLPALTPVYGTLDVSYRPIGATVSIDGKAVGTTPGLISDIIVGRHEVSIAKDGFQTYTGSVTITEGQTAKLAGTLAEANREEEIIEQMRQYSKEKQWEKAFELALTIPDNAEAQFYIAGIYNSGKLGYTDNAKYIEWTKKSAAQEHVPALRALGYAYEYGSFDVERNQELSYQYYEKAFKKLLEMAKTGDEDAMHNLAWAYEYGKGTPQNKTESRKLYEKLLKIYKQQADRGDLDAMTSLGLYYKYGNGTSVNPSESMKWYKKAADLGYAPANYSLGSIYEWGENNVAADAAKALQYYKKAAEGGDIWCMYHVGEMYEEGKGVSKNMSEAKKWYERAAAEGFDPARKKLENMKTTMPNKAPFFNLPSK